MKKPEEYFKKVISEELVKEWGWDSLEEFMNGNNKDQIAYTLEMIEQAQKDAYNEALEDAYSSVEYEFVDIKDDKVFDYTDVLVDSDIDCRINKQLILKLKK